jgi:hypothetical protein
MTETGWKAAEIARRMEPGTRAAMGRRWDEVIYCQRLLTLEQVYQDAAASGGLSLLQAYELFRAPAIHRPALFTAIQGGKTCKAVRAMADDLAKARAVNPRFTGPGYDGGNRPGEPPMTITLQ